MLTCDKCRREPPQGALFCPFCGAAIVPPQEPGQAIDPLVGQTIRGTYLVQEKLGDGGMGQVYKATQINLDRPVALKLLRPWFHSDPTIVQRFQREARASSKLHHPNVIAVLDFGQAEDGTLFMAMEYLPGRNLLSLLREEFPLGESRVIHVGAQILSALTEAHAAGIVHRDLKPANVMVETRRDEPDFVKVVDFGIAQIREPGDGDGQLTQTGLICGTPDYMSPEQASLLPLDARSDLYSVGVILYEMATGRHPFDAATPPAMVQAHAVEQPPPMAERCPPGRAVSPALEALVMRALAKNATDRFQTAEEMRRELLECPLDPALAEGAASAGRTPLPRGARAAPASPPFHSGSYRGPPSRATPPPSLAPPDEAAPPRPPASLGPTAPPPGAGTPAPSGPSSEAEGRPPPDRRSAPLVVVAAVATIAAIGSLVFLFQRGDDGPGASRGAQGLVLEERRAPPRAAVPSPQLGATASPADPAGAVPAPGPMTATASAPDPKPDLHAAGSATAAPASDEILPKPAATSIPPPRPTRATPRASPAAAAARTLDRKRPGPPAAPQPSVTEGLPAATAASSNPARAAAPETGETANGTRRETFVTREILAYQQSFGDPELKGRGRGLVGKARWLLEPRGTFVFAPADEAPGFFPLTARATREGNRVWFEGARTAAATGGQGYIRISGDLLLTGEPILTVDLEFGRAQGTDGAELQPTYRARARLRLAAE